MLFVRNIIGILRVEELLVGVVNFEMYVKLLNIKREQSIESLRQGIRKKS